MNYIRYAKWVAIILLILALILTPQLGVSLPLRLQGTVYDSGPQGYTILVSSLAKHLDGKGGLYLSLPDPRVARGAVIVVLDPQYCKDLITGASYIDMLLSWARRANATGLVILGESSCAVKFLERFLPVERVIPVRLGAFNLGDTRVVTDTLLYVEYPCGGSICRSPVVVLGRFVFIGDSDFLRNGIVSNHPEYLSAFYELLDRVTGGTLRPVVFFTLPETGDISFIISPYLLALHFFSMLSRAEKVALAVNPLPLLTLYTLIASVILYRFAVRGSRPSPEQIYYQPEPPRLLGVTPVYERVVRSRRLRGWEARLVVIRLYEILDKALRYRIGVGVEDIIRKGAGIDTLASLTGRDKAELFRLLNRIYRLWRKARGLAIRPIFVRWGRETKILTIEVSALLKKLGIELEKLRGLEVLVEYGESGGGKETS